MTLVFEGVVEGGGKRGVEEGGGWVVVQRMLEE